MPPEPPVTAHTTSTASPRRAHVITVSDRSAAGLRDDQSGPAVMHMLASKGWECGTCVVPDNRTAISAAILAAWQVGAAVVVTTGGTGIAPRDVTPEATADVVDKTLPGLTHLMCAAGVVSTPYAALSRGIAGVRLPREGQAGGFVLNVPGSPRGATESLSVVVELLDHIVDQMRGGDH